jgi:hypothetical protein
MRVNGLTDPTQLPVGRLLIIPAPLVPKIRIPLYANPQWIYIIRTKQWLTSEISVKERPGVIIRLTSQGIPA